MIPGKNLFSTHDVSISHLSIYPSIYLGPCQSVKFYRHSQFCEGSGVKKIVLSLPPSKFSGWANNQITRDRSTGENQHFNVCTGNSHKNESEKDNEAKLGIRVILDEGEMGGTRLRFQRKEAILGQLRTSGTCAAGEFLLGSPENPEGGRAQGLVRGAGPCSAPACLPRLIQVHEAEVSSQDLLADVGLPICISWQEKGASAILYESFVT